MLKNTRVYIEEKKARGHYIGLPPNIISGGVNRTDKYEEVRKLLVELNCPFVSSNADYLEDFLDVFGESMPATSGPFEFTYKVTETTSLHVYVEDSYFGFGEYDAGGSVDGLLVEDNTTREEIEEVVEFLKKSFKGIY